MYQLTQGEAGVGQHQEVAARHQEPIEEDGISRLIAVAADSIGQDLRSNQGDLHRGLRVWPHLVLVARLPEADLHEALLPAEAGEVAQLELHAAALALHHGGVGGHGEAPEHEGGGGGHHVPRAVPGEAAQQLRVVLGVAGPGAGLQQVDRGQDLLAAGGGDQVLAVAPGLQQAGTARTAPPG